MSGPPPSSDSLGPGGTAGAGGAVPGPAAVAEAVDGRTREVVGVLAGLDDAALSAPSRLPGWSRLTIVCHLRFGAVTLRRMTADALAGRPTAFYPDGREAQRPSTLVPAPGESPADVVRALAAEAEALADAWAALAADDWATPIVLPGGEGAFAGEPAGDLAFHGVLRLTEVEVHGADLDVGLDRWSPTFVAVALPSRLVRLPAQRRRPDAAPDVHARWALRDTAGPTYLVTVAGPDVTITTVPAPPEGPAQPGEPLPDVDGTVEGSAHDLVAFLLGRPAPGLVLSDPSLHERFRTTFPGP
jgi:maleylpyruvate isomerase